MDLFVPIPRDQNGCLEGGVAPIGSRKSPSSSSTLEPLMVLEDVVVISVAQVENEVRRGHPSPQDTARRQL
jgi:hypothetical protein